MPLVIPKNVHKKDIMSLRGKRAALESGTPSGSLFRYVEKTLAGPGKGYPSPGRPVFGRKRKPHEDPRRSINSFRNPESATLTSTG